MKFFPSNQFPVFVIGIKMHIYYTNLCPAKALTCFGLNCVTLSPWPNRPYSPQPQVYNSPEEVMAALWLEPHAMSRTLLAFKASTNLGFSQDNREQ